MYVMYVIVLMKTEGDPHIPKDPHLHTGVHHFQNASYTAVYSMIILQLIVMFN